MTCLSKEYYFIDEIKEKNWSEKIIEKIKNFDSSNSNENGDERN